MKKLRYAKYVLLLLPLFLMGCPQISGELEIDKVIGPLLIPIEVELRIPFHVVNTEIIGEEGMWTITFEGEGVLDDCTVEYNGEFGIQNLGGELMTNDLDKPFLYFNWKVYETEYWTRICPDYTDNGKWTPDLWESGYDMPLVDGYTVEVPNMRFRYTMHLNTTHHKRWM